MTINFRRALPSALLLGACASAYPLAAQPPLPPTEIAQIADEVLGALIPPTQAVSRVPVAKRKIFFDHTRTLAAFGNPGPAQVSTLPLHAAVKSGSQRLLDDCSPVERKPCNRLGWGVYAWIEPLSITTSKARVRANIVWPDRGDAVFHEGAAPTGPAYLYGFSAEVDLTRSQDGSWKFEKRRATVAGE